jgi:hypothetical protein
VVNGAVSDAEVQPELERFVRERMEPPWHLDIAGADLVIAS